MTTLAADPGQAETARSSPVQAASRPLWPLALTAGALLCCFIAIAGSTSLALAAIAGVAAAAVLNLRRRSIDPVELAVAVQLTVYVAFPFAHLAHDRLTSYVVVGGALVVFGSAQVGRRETGLPRGRVLVSALFLLLATTSALSPDTGAVKQLVTIAVAAVPLFVLGGQLSRDRLPVVSAVVVTLAAVESITAMAEPFLFPHHLWGPAQVDSSGDLHPLVNAVLPGGLERSQGTLGHPLPLGLLLVLGIALLYRAAPTLRRGHRVALVCLLVLGLCLAGDRNALLTAVVVVVSGQRSTLKRLAGWCLTGAIVAVLLAEAGADYAASLSDVQSSGSFVHRIAATGALGRLVYHQLPAHIFFGNGFASTPRVFAKGLLQGDGFDVVDNQFVLIQSQGGLLCLVLLLLLAALTVSTCGHRLRPAALSVVVVMLIFDSLLWPSATAMTFLLFGLALGTRPTDP